MDPEQAKALAASLGMNIDAPAAEAAPAPAVVA